MARRAEVQRTDNSKLGRAVLSRKGPPAGPVKKLTPNEKAKPKPPKRVVKKKVEEVED